ncbi:hypothetical protein ACIA49_28580 [Kribbella sp. NPDC051587]|uniref:hypothetical protein n=1 Tax=Kribbella sp. NPDC051587 TaxID=3364119 RepID=UPI0037B441FA
MALTPKTSRTSCGDADVRTVMIYIDDDGRSERVSAITDDLGRVMRAVPRHLRRAT